MKLPKKIHPLVVMIPILVIAVIFIFHEDNSGVEVGQIWIKDIGDPNPFHAISPAEHCVLEVRGDWVKHVNTKYLDHKRMYLFVWTGKICWFKRGKHLKTKQVKN